MKNLRRLLPALCLLLISAMCAGTSTYAWFSMNNAVSATGMSIKANASGNLVISTSMPDTTTTEATVAVYNGEAISLKPAMHITDEDTYGTYTTGLLTVSNSGDVDSTTGKEKTGKTLTYVSASSTDYYVDYIVYIANQGVTATSLTAAFMNVTANTDTLKAGTIDFYAASVTSETTASALVNKDNYCGKLNVQSAGSVPIAANVPVATGSAAIAVLMRLYFDGNAESQTVSGSKLIRSNSIDLSDLNISIQFSTAQ